VGGVPASAGHQAHHRLQDLINIGADIVTTEVVIMELLAGEWDEVALADLRSTMLEFPVLRVHGLSDFEQAATLYWRCRAGGKTIRSLSDCVIAAVAIRAGATVLHTDRDFDALAQHTELRIESVGA
jgi:predicted nucleic acid-binding protein